MNVSFCLLHVHRERVNGTSYLLSYKPRAAYLMSLMIFFFFFFLKEMRCALKATCGICQQRLFMPINSKMLLSGKICERLVMCANEVPVTKQIQQEPTHADKFLDTRQAQPKA